MTDPIKVHLFSTDKSVFALTDFLPDNVEVVALVYPSNRQHSDKVIELLSASRDFGVPAVKHNVGQPLPSTLPPADAGVCWLYAQVILTVDIPRYRLGILNNHGATIPEYRGFHCGQWSIVEGESELGVTWHGITAVVDGGPIWMESKIPIPLAITGWELRQEAVAEGIRIFPEAWHHFIEQDIKPRIPDLSVGKWWRPRNPEDGQIAVGLTHRKIHDIIRASCPPWPRAFVEIEGKRLYVDAITDEKAPGALLYESVDQGFIGLRVIEQDSG